MPRPIEERANMVLKALAQPPNARGMKGEELAKSAGLPIAEAKEAAELLHGRQHVDFVEYIGSGFHVAIKPGGRASYERQNPRR